MGVVTRCARELTPMQVRLASVRRSLFVNDGERSKFLNALVTGTRDILRAQQGLAEHANYHEFCRLLGRLKTNYQLSELVRASSGRSHPSTVLRCLLLALSPGRQVVQIMM